MEVGGVPSCGEPGHELYRVHRDGWRGKAPRRRQRWRCVGPEGSHKFMTPLPRFEALTQACLDCEHDLHPSQGKVAARGYLYVAREVAAALTGIARGQTYMEASKTVRTSVGRYFEAAQVAPPWTTGFDHGQLAATWVETYAEVVLGDDEDTSWPTVVVLDGTDFYRRQGGRQVAAFSVLCAYGYDFIEVEVPGVEAMTFEQRLALDLDPFAVFSDADLEDLTEEQAELLASFGLGTPRTVMVQTGQRLLRAWASPTRDTPAWEAFLRSWPGVPRVVVCDGDPALSNACERAWGTIEYDGLSVPASELVRCQWHLLKNLRGHIINDLVGLEVEAARQKAENAGKEFRAPNTTPLRALAEKMPEYEVAARAFDDAASWVTYRTLATAKFDKAAFGVTKEGVRIESATLRWLDANEDRVLNQLARAGARPGPSSNGPIEAYVGKFRGLLARRAQALANQARTQLLLRLIVAGMRAQADEALWAERVREYLVSLEAPRHISDSSPRPAVPERSDRLCSARRQPAGHRNRKNPSRTIGLTVRIRYPPP